MSVMVTPSTFQTFWLASVPLRLVRGLLAALVAPDVDAVELHAGNGREDHPGIAGRRNLGELRLVDDRSGLDLARVEQRGRALDDDGRLGGRDLESRRRLRVLTDGDLHVGVGHLGEALQLVGQRVEAGRETREAEPRRGRRSSASSARRDPIRVTVTPGRRPPCSSTAVAIDVAGQLLRERERRERERGREGRDPEGRRFPSRMSVRVHPRHSSLRRCLRRRTDAIQQRGCHASSPAPRRKAGPRARRARTRARASADGGMPCRRHRRGRFRSVNARSARWIGREAARAGTTPAHRDQARVAADLPRASSAGVSEKFGELNARGGRAL